MIHVLPISVGHCIVPVNVPVGTPMGNFSPIGTTHESEEEKIHGTYLNDLYLVSSFEIE